VQTGSAGGTSFSNVGVSLRQILLALGAPGAVALAPEGASAVIRGGDDFSVLIQALNSSTRANLLSTPSITTLDNQPAEIIVGQNVPFRTGIFTTEGNSTNPFTTIQREDVGITLRVIPRIHDGDVIRLDVAQEVSSLVNANLAGAADLITNRRSIETTVLADNGQTIVLGGLISDDRLSSNSQVPLLGDIPVLGRAFRSNRESVTRKTLLSSSVPQSSEIALTWPRMPRPSMKDCAVRNRCRHGVSACWPIHQGRGCRPGLTGSIDRRGPSLTTGLNVGSGSPSTGRRHPCPACGPRE
jgi:general secretion pathway protein D